MTPEATEMLEALNAPYKMDPATQNAEIKRLASNINSLAKVFDEMLLADNIMFERIFLMNWCALERCRIASEYIGTASDILLRSPDLEEIMRFTAEMVTSETLAKIFNVANKACGVSLREFVFGWRALNEGGELKYIFFNRKLDIEKLHPSAKAAYLQDKKERDSEERMQQSMREEFLSNSDRENNE